MRVWFQNNGRAAGGLFGIATAVAFWFDLKALGITLAACALVLVASAEFAKKK